MAKFNEEKLGKIVQLAKSGIGGEKDTALAIIKRLCLEQSLNFDDVMQADDKISRYTFPYRNKFEKQIVVQVCYLFGQPAKDGVSESTYYKKIFLQATAIRYIETLAAMEVYLRAYRKERARMIKDLPGAFVIKHSIYAKSDGPERTYTEEELESFRRQYAMSENMEDVILRKQIEDKNA